MVWYNNFMNKIIIRVRGIILQNNKFLLVNLPGNDYYCLPGGKLEHGEDIKDCLERELVEELGVKPQVGRLLYVNNFIDKENNQNIDFMFEVLNGGDYLDLNNKERTHAFEISEIIWVEKGQDIKVLPIPMKTDFDKGELLSDQVRFIG